ncbi:MULTISPECIES: hypothetical protein [Streptomyces]|uniref:hypothetical protein n=1 Tax=Streptomyces TaxID=1883 RepID=UPI0011F0AA5D|nr:MULTISPECIES: hypothetical protein [Streptomyces]QHF94030.1 hypothetical protein DEH18_09380 [Streptomyces sp. NHF165]
MDWGTLASTATGGLIGVVSTLSAEWFRTRRDRESTDHADRRRLYGEYLAALSHTRSELRATARDTAASAEERARRALDSFHTGGAYELRYQVAITAPESVVAASTEAFRALRDMRDLLHTGALRTDPAYAASRDRWEDAFAELRARIRCDLVRPPRRRG